MKIVNGTTYNLNYEVIPSGGSPVVAHGTLGPGKNAALHLEPRNPGYFVKLLVPGPSAWMPDNADVTVGVTIGSEHEAKAKSK